jgi:formate dehydrogenase subunit delta
MNINNLVSMLNQMGDFFEAMPDRSQAKLDLITHVKKFWEPRMKNSIIEEVNNDIGLSPFVKEALVENIDKIKPQLR